MTLFQSMLRHRVIYAVDAVLARAYNRLAIAQRSLLRSRSTIYRIEHNFELEGRMFDLLGSTRKAGRIINNLWFSLLSPLLRPRDLCSFLPYRSRLLFLFSSIIERYRECFAKMMRAGPAMCAKTARRRVNCSYPRLHEKVGLETLNLGDCAWKTHSAETSSVILFHTFRWSQRKVQPATTTTTLRNP